VVDGVTLEEVSKKALEHVLEKHTNDFNSLTYPGGVEKDEAVAGAGPRGWWRGNVLSLAARGVNDRVVIVLALYEFSCASDQGEVGEAVGPRLRPAPEDLCHHLWIGNLLNGIDP